MLFDLELDPEESTNVVFDPKYKQDKKRLSAQLQVFKSKSERYLPND